MNPLDRVESWLVEIASKPKPPAQVWILSAVLALGLIAQYIGGEAAFSLLERGPIYSAAASALIEAMAMAEAFTLTISYKAKTDDDKEVGKLAFNPFALGGLVISLVCSGVYNAIWVADAVPHLEPYQIAAFAVGPLAALAAAGLTLGSELREHLMKCAALEDAQEKTARDTADAAQAKLDKAEQSNLEFEQSVKLLEVQADLANQARQIELDDIERKRKTRARERAERRLEKVSAQAPNDSDVSAHQAPTKIMSAPWAGRWATMADFVSDVKTTPDLVSGMNGADFARQTGKPGSTSRRWMAAAQEAVSNNGRH